jgi:polysaccharide pyruvyl transferase WcaK-like protein
VTTVGYLGWQGHDNLGDDAIAEVLATALDVDLVPVPTAPVALARLATARRRRTDLAPLRLLLGGGTVIGRGNWRLPVLAGAALCAGGPPLLIGAGVEDPTFRGSRSFSGLGELRRWRRVLARFERVTVRGPRSQALLADIGVTAQVVGDPALLELPDATPDPDGHIVLALGYGDDLRGHDHAVVESTVADALGRAGDQHIVVVAVGPGDQTTAARVAAALGPRAEFRAATSPAAFAAVVDGASVVVAERLHAGILAAAAGFAPVLLAYQPKVDDFGASVGLDVHPTDALDPGALADAITRSSGAEARAAVATSVAELRRRLDEEVTAIRAALGAAAPVGAA